LNEISKVSPMHIVIAMTGASGVTYGINLLKALEPYETTLVMTETAEELIKDETEHSVDEVIELATRNYSNDDLWSPIASGSSSFDACIIAPCTLSTLGKIANGISDNLVTRVASVCLKERRPLVLLIRETPLSLIHIKNMERVTKAGAIVVPASPGFYNRPKEISDLVDFIVGKLCSLIGIKTDLLPEWEGIRPLED